MISVKPIYREMFKFRSGNFGKLKKAGFLSLALRFKHFDFQMQQHN